ncbi:Beta-glucosidase-like glycosyl hydrolase [Aminobacter sp. Y103A]|nr:Beta-glucosidase-like glycosyl hydrolase [Aminobacter sp. SS-2016]
MTMPLTIDRTQPKAVVFGCSGTSLSAAERSFFRAAQPWGFILHKRNCADPAQLRTLVAELRESVGRSDVRVLIDQEGGRVARLAPPHWRAPPPASLFAQIARTDVRRALDAVRLNARLVAAELFDLGIDINIAPVLDLPIGKGDLVIGDRALGDTPEMASILGRATCEGLLAGGVLPVIKHILGHGRARQDKSEALLVVNASLDEMQSADFVPFRSLQDMPCAMAAHVIYRAIDRDAPATASRTVIDEIIRGMIRFDGVLMSDDVSDISRTHALDAQVSASQEAGCDVILHGSGDMDEMQRVADAAMPLSENAVERLQRAERMRRRPSAIDLAETARKLEELLKPLGARARQSGATRSSEIVGNVAKKIERDIVLGRILPKERIMEDELVYGLGVKRHVARAVLQELARTGLVKLEPYRGAVVRHLSPDDLVKLHDVRQLLIAAAVQRIRLPVSPVLMNKLEHARQIHRSAISVGDLELAYVQNRAFHDLLLEATGNEFIARAIHDCDAGMRSIDAASLMTDSLIEPALAEHDEMIKALEDHDLERLGKLCAAHFDRPFAHHMANGVRH